MKSILLFAILYLLSFVSLYAETATTGDTFKLYFDLTTSGETTTRKAMFPTLFFSADNPLDTGEGWTSRIYDMDGKPLTSEYTHISLEDDITMTICDYGYLIFYSPIGNIKGYFEFTNLIGSFELIDEADPQVSAHLSNGLWETDKNTGHFLLGGKLKLIKAGTAIPKIPRLSVGSLG